LLELGTEPAIIAAATGLTETEIAALPLETE
jgi:hypothetical protein